MGEFQINMPPLLEKKQLTNDLQNVFSEFPEVPILLHSDLLKIGLTAAPTERTQICKDYEEALMLSLKERPLLIPTFNYDFCKNGVYNRQESPSQVGALSDYFRVHYAHTRSLTPIFNFVILDPHKKLPTTTSSNVFGQDSLFAHLFKQNGLVLFLGADFATNTFLHYVEECAKIGYRYIKSFSGTIQDGEKEFPITVDYRVRPWFSPSIAYDFPKLQKEAEEAHILKECQVGYGKLLYYHAKELFAFWSEKIAHDELYLLTQESQTQIRSFYESKGYPLELYMFEAIKSK